MRFGNVRRAINRCNLTSLIDWLPSGLILNDPVWMVFFGSTLEIAHSISSTRARHAIDNTGEFKCGLKDQINVSLCVFGIHTSTFDVLPLTSSFDEGPKKPQQQVCSSKNTQHQVCAPHLASVSGSCGNREPHEHAK